MQVSVSIRVIGQKGDAISYCSFAHCRERESGRHVILAGSDHDSQIKSEGRMMMMEWSNWSDRWSSRWNYYSSTLRSITVREHRI